MSAQESKYALRMKNQRAYQKEWYRLHKEDLLARRKAHQQELKSWFATYKRSLSCSVCHESHPACLQFHHRNPAEKRFTIGNTLAHTYISFETLVEEICKCEVLCSNCHAKLHWRKTHSSDLWLDPQPDE